MADDPGAGNAKWTVLGSDDSRGHHVASSTINGESTFHIQTIFFVIEKNQNVVNK